MAESATKTTVKPVSAAKPVRAALRKREPKTLVQPAVSAPVAAAAIASAATPARKQPLAAAGGGSGTDWEMS